MLRRLTVPIFAVIFLRLNADWLSAPCLDESCSEEGGGEYALEMDEHIGFVQMQKTKGIYQVEEIVREVHEARSDLLQTGDFKDVPHSAAASAAKAEAPPMAPAEDKEPKRFALLQTGEAILLHNVEQKVDGQASCILFRVVPCVIALLLAVRGILRLPWADDDFSREEDFLAFKDIDPEIKANPGPD